ncbi:hypothetical protein HYALB_00002369 [Hymenoscyphus albidus]|uniref:BZIP domain-containing protein n=1 Tax=Hymenoscyphus albidus TaxID=595503 RepID=A0A9N9LP38_9HELO|nr:hypothetical protein HYALB_00002369 [Hymenoscyphus albidus]
MSVSSQHSPSTMSNSNSQNGCLDPLDSLIDFSGYEQVSYHSPSMSPSAVKSEFTTRAVSNTPPSLPSNSQPVLSGPSHQYDLYKQQTGIPQGAIANTLAINQNNAHINSQFGFSDNNFMSGLSTDDDFVDFNTAPTRNGSFNPSELDLDFSTDSTYFYPEQASSSFVDPSAIAPATNALPSQTSNVGRLWPGMHQQQALAKAQAQQKQQQQLIQQQRKASTSMGHSRQPSTQRARASHPPTDPIVEEKISQLLNSMRQNSVGSDDHSQDNTSHAQRMRKDEMDEDERLLASEEGKKLSSKERRQLRNKVSARAFRSRRKEYISQLEGEIAGKVTENQDLRSTNRALMEENTRLSDLTRMLLSSPSFSGFLDNLSQNPAAVQTAQQATQPRVEQPQQQQPQRQVRKDVNPYAAQQQMQNQQHIGMTLIPEHTMDYSMLDLGQDGSFSYQPQVFSVLSMPETVIDSEMLSGKSSTFTPLASDDEKIELPTIERAPEASAIEEPTTVVEVVDEEFDADPTFALFASTPTAATPVSKEQEFTFDFAAMFSKPSQYELVVVPTADTADLLKMERLTREMEIVSERLSQMNL